MKISKWDIIYISFIIGLIIVCSICSFNRNDNIVKLPKTQIVESVEDVTNDWTCDKNLMDILSYITFFKIDYPQDNSSDNLNQWYKALIYKSYWNSNVDWLICYDSYEKLITYWKDYIPEEYVYIVVNESLLQNIPIPYVYAICMKESAFKYMVSFVCNENGTKDYGLMGLNELNFNDTTWLKDCFYFDNEYDENVEFNIHNNRHVLKAGIKHFKNCIELAEGDYHNAAIIYNCGAGNFLRNTIPPMSSDYGIGVSLIASEFKEPMLYGYFRDYVEKCYYEMGITVDGVLR